MKAAQKRLWGVIVTFGILVGAWGVIHWLDRELRMPPGDCRYLESLKPEHARADAEKAASVGDLHLLGVLGYALDVPGVAANHLLQPAQQTVQPIPCTTDRPVSRRQERLDEAARIYADRYNRRVLELSSRLR